jgi:hypothetical protein
LPAARHICPRFKSQTGTIVHAEQLQLLLGSLSTEKN